MNDLDSPFDGLTHEELRLWAEPRIYARGLSYQRAGRVEDLRLAEEGGLLAWVSGTERYAVHVLCDEGILISDCSCPYWSTCKHAVAVVLEQLAAIAEGRCLESCPEGDPRLVRLGLVPDDTVYVEPAGNILDRLEALDRNELMTVLLRLVQRDPRLAKLVQDELAVVEAPAARIAATIRDELAVPESEPAEYWQDSAFGGRATSDWDEIACSLALLADRNASDELIALAGEIFEAAATQLDALSAGAGDPQPDDEERQAWLEHRVAACSSILLDRLDDAELVDDRLELLLSWLLADRARLIDIEHPVWQIVTLCGGYEALAEAFAILLREHEAAELAEVLRRAVTAIERRSDGSTESLLAALKAANEASIRALVDAYERSA